MKEHEKHPTITRAQIGNFGRNEIALLGSPCSNIKELAFDIIKKDSQKNKISYVDADHKSGDKEETDTGTALSYGASMEYIDKINFHRFNYKLGFNEYQIKYFFQDEDLIIVNGNHFEAKNQIVIVDPAKPLQKKLNKLKQVMAYILKDCDDVPDYLKEHDPSYKDVPRFHWDEKDKISSFVQEAIKENIPKLKGLVLAGGKSSRMKQDKALLRYHGKNQIEHTYDLLKPFCQEVYISCPADQKEKVSEGFAVIEDSFDDLGPFGAILSAFKKFPDAAWLVVACDLPLLDVKSLNHLIVNRKSSSVATAFLDSEKKFPEPLITIWEPKSYLKLLYFLSLGFSCPRKVLINSDCYLIEAPDRKALLNVNYPEEYEDVKGGLEGSI